MRKGFIEVCLLTTGMFWACERQSPHPVEVTAPADQNEVRAVIGSQGGKMAFNGGASFEVPGGILQEEVTFSFKRSEPMLDLPGKDVLDKGYSISPKVNFSPGTAKLSIPVNRDLPGTLSEIKLGLYCYGRKVSMTPQGELSNETWFPCPEAALLGRSQQGNYLEFSLTETSAHRADKPPFGIMQVAFDVSPAP